MNKLILTVGLPQSGKSTWAESQPHPIVSPDAVRLALHGKPFIGSAEPFVWAIAKTMAKALFIAGHDTVIVDATNTTKKRRDEWKSKEWRREFKEFKEDVNVCKERAVQACGSDSEHREGLLAAIERMHSQFEPVGDEELNDPF